MVNEFIWCEITCRLCGTISNASGWYSPETIANLKADIKRGNFMLDTDRAVVCKECYKKSKI